MDDEQAATADLGEAVTRTPRRSNRMQFHALPSVAEETAPHPRTITGAVRPVLPLASAVADREASLQASVSLGRTSCYDSSSSTMSWELERYATPLYGTPGTP
jgi:hypothetical protein